MTARRVHRVAQVAELIGMSDDFVLHQIRTGALRARKLGRFLVVADADLDTYLAALPDASVERRPAASDERAAPTPLRANKRRSGGRVQKLVYPRVPS